ncbi:MAG TPA: hypothetical protein VE959_05735 [Bryobacteraceae bacterium]|nr:hypothetical protein [Bryobacteraceae bacterium]
MNGVSVTNIAGTDGIVNSILLQSDGKILVYVGGNAVLRFDDRGKLDPAFGGNGIEVLPTPVGGSLALQPNGQLVIGGVVTPGTGGAELGVARLNSDGIPDASFGSGGLSVVSLGNRAPNVGSAVLLQPNGGILVCSTLISVGRGQPYQTALARFTPTGALDTNFGSQGLSIQTGVNGCTALALLSNGDYLVVNSQAIAEFTANGIAKSTVTGGTVVATSQSSAAFVASTFDPLGGYLLGSELFVGEESRGHNSSAEVLRFSQTGTEVFSSTFHFSGTGGSGIEALVRGVAVQANGEIVAVGDQITFTQSGAVTVNGLARLSPTGSLDTTFGSGGTVVNNLPPSSGVVIQPDGNIVTVGFASNNTGLTLSRYLGQ